MSPNSGGGTPISFKPNVNRAKTKRWVEARSYSYDGNDWGDDDDDEYDEEPPPPVPQPHKTAANPSGLPRPSFPGDRSKSTDQVLTVEPDEASGRSRSADDGKKPEAGDSSSSKPAPFVRPADIYKRMREDRAKAGLPVATRSNTDPTASPLGQEPTTSNLPSATPREAPPIIKLPEVKRSSGIGTDFIGGAESGNTQDTQTQSAEEQHRLQHNPSLGFRSAVNQAFDVPETPSSTVESVGRSNSDSTSVSPIMPSRGLNDEKKTPTIAEEPGDVTPKDVDRNIIFKPGHRRDLSLPSPDNSPSRKPKIMDNEEAPPSAIAQLSSTTLPDSSKDQPLPSLQQPKRASVQLPSTSGKDLPAPLRVSSSQTLLAGSNEAPAVAFPSLSAENSPQDTESDRLRKEIIRSLSRENTPSEQGSRPQTGHEDASVPNKYESYWSDELTQSPQEQPNPPMPEHNPPSTNSQDVSAPNDPPALGLDPAPWQDRQPKLTRRFSWESSSSDELEPVTGTYSQDPPVPGQLPPDNDTVPPIAGTQDEPASQPVTEKPKLTIIPPSAGDGSSIISGQHLPEVVYPPPTEPPAGAHQPPVPTSNALVPIPKNMLGFRDILGIRSADERIRAFDRTREQFGSFDTGLTHWMQVTLEAHPEHGDIVGQNMKLSAGASKALGRSKFPKLPSLGNFGASNSQGAPPGHGHVRRTSAPLGSMKVEQRGKDFLHTAGNLGGRAGEAAKGFFARGRSKFKGSGNEKVDT